MRKTDRFTALLTLRLRVKSLSEYMSILTCIVKQSLNGLAPMRWQPALLDLHPLWHSLCEILGVRWASMRCFYSYVPAGRLSPNSLSSAAWHWGRGRWVNDIGKGRGPLDLYPTASSAFDSSACEMAGMSPLSVGRAGLRASRGSRSVSGPSQPWKGMRLAEDVQREEDRGDGLARWPAGLEECGVSTRRPL